MTMLADLPRYEFYRLLMPHQFRFTDEVEDWLLENVGDEVYGVAMIASAVLANRCVWVRTAGFEGQCFRFTDAAAAAKFKLRWY
jgi:hypothetical protein